MASSRFFFFNCFITFSIFIKVHSRLLTEVPRMQEAVFASREDQKKINRRKQAHV